MSFCNPYNPEDPINYTARYVYGKNLEILEMHKRKAQEQDYGAKNPAACFNRVGTILKADSSDFVVTVDVQYFDREDIEVAVRQNMIKVECKHDEKQDEQGSVYRHFVRNYRVPFGGAYEMDSTKAVFSSDNVLTISVPLRVKENEPYREIPIELTEVPSKLFMQKNKNEVVETSKPEDPKTEELKVPGEA